MRVIRMKKESVGFVLIVRMGMSLLFFTPLALIASNGLFMFSEERV
jgi:hypothetical protein